MITVNQAVPNAVNYFRALTGYSGTPVLEEVEMVNEEGAQYWLITLSYLQTPGGMGIVLPGYGTKDYKVFKVRGDDGNVVSMKIRQIA